jgi:hypothetical protein
MASPHGDTVVRPVAPKRVFGKRTEKNKDGSPRLRGVIRISESVSEVLEDPSKVDEWDDEELRRGRRRDRNGKFTGRDPVVIPTAVYREMVRRSIRKAEVEMTTNLEAACKMLTGVIGDMEAEDRDRIKAAEILLNRVMGKEATKVELSSKSPLFLGIIQAGIVAGGEPVAIGVGADEDDIIDADVVDDDIEFE